MSGFEASQDLLKIYIEDARGHLEALDACLLALERDGYDAETVAQVLGPLHTLKGNSGMLGLTRIKEYVHRLEDVFQAIGDGRLELGPGAFETLFSGATALRDGVERAVAEGGAEARDLRAEQDDLDALLGDEAPARAPQAARRPSSAPDAPEAAPSVPAPAGAEARRDGDKRDVADKYVTARSSMVRVDFGQLDQLLNLVGELIIYRTKLHDLARELSQRLGATGSEGRELIEAVQQVANVSSQLQETVMDIRMLPIRHVFERFPRVVRDLAHQQGKQIELLLEGQNTRVDKAIIDEIGEPLIHMIRNAIDHGIEEPEARVRKGKSRTGTLLLAAAQESNHVVVTIMDDGSGIDLQGVRRQAVARGLLKPEQSLSDREIVQTIFAPGFSTSATVSEISGRGVGLDVVLKSIERLNGMVEVETVAGVGTKFIIRLPLTLAIIAALLVEVSGQAYAVPLSNVVESLRFQRGDVHRINGRDALRIRDRIVPLVPLAELFGLEDRAEAEHRYAVVLGRGDKKLGLVVDRLRGQQEVVIKALDEAVSGAAFGVAGATIMGDGRVVLILDVAALFDIRRLAGARVEAALGAG
jgi:two-component system chemotaxis sensor kinase CheA